MNDEYALIPELEKEFKWDERRNEAAILLATGHTILDTSQKIEVSEKTIYNWKKRTDFAVEVDRLSLMYAMASKAFRMQLLNRMARQKIKDDGTIELDDTTIMDILKEARLQSEGTRIDITTIYEALSDEARSVARSRPKGDDKLSQPGQNSSE